MRSNVLEEVIKFCFQDFIENPPPPPPLPPSTPSTALPPSTPPSTDQPQTTTTTTTTTTTSTTNKKAAVVDSTRRTSFVFELKPDLVMELAAAADYLQIPLLTNHLTNMLAEYMDGIFRQREKEK